MMYHRLIFFLFTVLLSSCATMHHGSKQTVHINSIPQGAEVRINDSLMGITPLTLKVKRIKRLTITYTHPDFETRVFQAPRTFIRKRLMADFPFWFLGFNPFLFTDLVTGAAFEFDQTKLNPDLSDNSLFIKKSIPKITTPEDSIELAKIAPLNKKTKDSLYAIKVKMREEIRLAEIAHLQEKRRQKELLDSIENIRKTTFNEKRINIRNKYKNGISWQIGPLVHHEFMFSYTRYINKTAAWGIELGYKPSLFTIKNFDLKSKGFPQSTTEWVLSMPFSESKFISPFYKLYIDNKTPLNTYVSLQAFYRNNSYNNANFSWSELKHGSNHTYHDNLDLNQHVTGLKIQMGMNYIHELDDNTAIDFEVYSGLGFNYSISKLYHYYYYYEDYAHYAATTVNVPLAVNQSETKTGFVRTLHLGFKVGLRF